MSSQNAIESYPVRSPDLSWSDKKKYPDQCFSTTISWAKCAVKERSVLVLAYLVGLDVVLARMSREFWSARRRWLFRYVTLMFTVIATAYREVDIPVAITDQSIQNTDYRCRPANLENVFRGTFRVKRRDLPAKSGTVGRAHIEIFLEVYSLQKSIAFQNTL